MNLQDQVTQLSKLVTELTRKISVLENKIQGEGRVVLSKKELKVDRSTSTSEMLNFKDQVNLVIDLAVPGDGKFLRALSEQYKASNISYEDIASALSPIFVENVVGLRQCVGIGDVNDGFQGIFQLSGTNPQLVVDATNLNGTPGIYMRKSGGGASGIPTFLSYLGFNFIQGPSTVLMALKYNGEVTIPNLSGVGGRAVYADATGKLYC
jgi:hypothetical protein